MFFKKIRPKIFLKLELQLIVAPISLNIFIQHFAMKCKITCWTKQDRKFFTGDVWTMVNCCYKAHVFCVHSSM